MLAQENKQNHLLEAMYFFIANRVMRIANCGFIMKSFLKYHSLTAGSVYAVHEFSFLLFIYFHESPPHILMSMHSWSAIGLSMKRSSLLLLFEVPRLFCTVFTSGVTPGFLRWMHFFGACAIVHLYCLICDTILIFDINGLMG